MSDHGRRWCLTKEGRKGWTDVWIERRDVQRWIDDGWTVKQEYIPPHLEPVEDFDPIEEYDLKE